jgi:hypothetical protein
MLENLTINRQPFPIPPDLLFAKKTPFRPEVREEGRDWPLFCYTMIGHKRLRNVRDCIEQILASNIPGDFVEAGVWRGGCCIYMRALLAVHNITDRTVWLADSFEGLPPPGPVDQSITTQRLDLHTHPHLKVSLEQVQQNFRRFSLLDDQVRFLKGWFKDTLATAPIDRIALLRLDGDLYDSTLDSLSALYHKVTPGGFVIIDDYNGWEGCRRAVDEFRQTHNITAEIKKVDWTGVYWQVA